MKKLLVMMGLAAAVAASAADNDTLLTFSTQGPDKYADGTTVLDGEVYAVIWTKAGSEFGGIATDGTLLSADDAIVAWNTAAQNGACKETTFVIDADKAAARGDGTYGVYLLDTRVADADGNTKAVGSLKTVNGVSAVTESSVAFSAYGQKTAVAEKATVGGQQITAGAAVLNSEGVEIKSIRVDGDYVYLTVEDKAGLVVVKEGDDPAAVDTQHAARALDGKGGLKELKFPKSDLGSGFFSATRSN